MIVIDYEDFEFESPATPINVPPALAPPPPESDSSPKIKGYLEYSLPSFDPNAVTADFTLEGENIWYSNWLLDAPGTLTKINQTEFELSKQSDAQILASESFSLPSNLNTPNGITPDNNGNI